MIGSEDKRPRGKVGEFGQIEPIPGQFDPSTAVPIGQPIPLSELDPARAVPVAQARAAFDPATAKLVQEGSTPDRGIISTLAEGFRSTGRAAGATLDTALDDRIGVVERADAQAKAPKAADLDRFNAELAIRRAQAGEDPDLLDALKAVGGAVLEAPKGAGLAALEQAPNAAAALGAAWGGVKVGGAGGAAIGTAIAGPAGTAIGGTIGAIGGGLVGLFGGNALLEVGHKAMEKAGDGQFTAEERGEALKEGATKAGVITAVDAVTLGASKWITGATARAVEAATARTLVDAGVDLSDQAAVLAARRSPEIVQRVRQAQQAAVEATSSFGQKAARGGAALSLETVGEGLGEYLGELAATGQADTIDAVLESVLSLGQSGAEVAWGASHNAGRLAMARLDPNAGPISRAAIEAQRQQATGAVSPPVVPEWSNRAEAEPATPPIPDEWAAAVDSHLGGSTEQTAAPAFDRSTATPGDQGNRFDPATARPVEQSESVPGEGDTAATTQPTARKLLPFKDADAAARRAEQATARTGQTHTVVPHPTIPDRLAVVPADSDIAAAATPANSADGLDVEALFRVQTPIPLKNARNLAGLLSRQGSAHVVVPAPTGKGFGVVPVEQISPAQREAWVGFQSSAGRGAARQAPEPVAAPPDVQGMPELPPQPIDGQATPTGTPESTTMTGRTPAVPAQAVPAAPPDSTQGLDTEARRATPALQRIDSDTVITAIGNAQSTIRRERWTQDGGRRFEGRVRAELERAGLPKEVATAVVDLARQQSPRDAFVTGDALVEAARTLGVVGRASTPPADQGTPDPDARFVVVLPTGRVFGTYTAHRDGEGALKRAGAGAEIRPLQQGGADEHPVPAKPAPKAKKSEASRVSLTPGQIAKGRDVILAQIDAARQRTAPADLVSDYAELKARIADARRRARLKSTKRNEATRLTEWADNQDAELERLREQIGFVEFKAGSARYKILNTPENIDAFAARLKKAPVGRWTVTVQPDEIYDNIETRPGTVESQRNAGRSAVAALAQSIRAWSVRAGRGSATLLGSGLYESFTATGGTSLVGQVAKTPADLAALAQVMRDPRFETFRVFYTRGDEIVGQVAYSSRLPAAVHLPDDLYAQVSQDKDGFGADGYYVLHNHPSGRAAPSREDIGLTRSVAATVPGFRAHVVIDRNQYAVIGEDGSSEVIDAPELASVDFHSNPELKHELLGIEIRGPRTLADIGKALQIEDGHATVVFTRRDGVTQLLMDLPAALLSDSSPAGTARIKAAVRRAARAVGAGGYRFVVVPQSGNLQGFRHLLDMGIFRDVVRPDGASLDATGLDAAADFLEARQPAKRVVEEPRGPHIEGVAEEPGDPYPSLETRPGTTERQRATGRAALEDLERTVIGMRGQKIGAAVLGARLIDEIRMTGGAQLIGKPVKDASDLAALGQVYRDNRFETWRAFFIKDGRIVGESAFTSRLAGAVYQPRDVKGWLSRELTRYGAGSVFTMHNHPNGPARPSLGDVNVASDLASVPGWAGEVIIDHNEWAHLTGEAAATGMDEATFDGLPVDELAHYGVTVTRDPSLGSVTPREARIEHSLLGASVWKAGDLPKIGKALQLEAGHAAIVLALEGKVQALVDVPLSVLQDTKSKLGRAKVKVLVRRLLRKTGGWERYVVTPKGARPLDTWLVRGGVFHDVVAASGTSTLATVRKRFPTFEWHDAIMRGERKVHQLYEPAGPGYDAAEPGTRRSRAAEAAPATGPVEDFNPGRATVREWIGHQLRQHRGWAMGALTCDQITDIWGRELPQVDQFDRVVQQMDLVRNRMAETADGIIERWRKLPGKEADRLADVMHAATLAQYDPDTREPATAEEQQIRAEFDALSMGAQGLYREVRDQYAATLRMIRDGLAARAERTGSLGRQIADEIRLKFDGYLRQGPYFSLARFGDFILIADRGDERIVEAFESSLQREKRAKGLRVQGFTVKLTARQQYSVTKDGAAGQFIGEVLEKINALDMDPGQKGALMDQLNQLAISALPDASHRKHFHHRKGTPGFSNDAMRAFAASQMHAGHHLARIRHADELALLIDEMRADIRAAAGDVDVTERQQVVNELTRRLDLMMNPTTHPVTAALGQVGFVMSLGGSVASGLVNMTQTPLVTFPWLGAKFGFDAAAGAILKASKDYFGGKWSKWSGFVMADNPNLSAEERGALRHLEDAGLINLTQASDLAGTANTDSTVSQRAFAINRAMKIVGWTFHTPEVFNRQVSALAAYRLARDGGQTHDQAIESARQALIRTHFDYSSSNRARFMAGNVTRVVTMFKQYSQQMTYLLWRNAHQALKGESAEVRREARRMLLGVASMHFAAAGSLGLPLGVFGVTPLLSLLALGMGDEDEPWDWKAEYRNWLADTFGKEGGEAIAHGPMRMLLSVDLASRVGLGDLWIRPPAKEAEGRDLVEAWMVTLLGPVAGYAGQMGTAAMAFEEGKFARGVEAMMPKFIASPLKAIRYETEGVRSWRGADLGITLSDADIIGTALGFQPSRLAEMYEGRAAVKGREARLQARREELVTTWYEALQAGDRVAVAESLDAIRKFNAKNRVFAISGQTLRQSAMARRRAQLQTAQGYYLSHRRAALREYGDFAVID